MDNCNWLLVPIISLKKFSQAKGLKRAIHSRLIDIDGDGDMDIVGTDRGIYWLDTKNP